MNAALDVWTGQAAPRPVDAMGLWKCDHCTFRTSCKWVWCWLGAKICTHTYSQRHTASRNHAHKCDTVYINAQRIKHRARLSAWTAACISQTALDYPAI